MSAGTGIAHSEYNHSRSETTHLLQIWIHPSQRGVAPGYEQKAFGTEEKRGRLRLVASPDGDQGSVSFSADAKIYAGLFDGSESASLALGAGRLGYVHVARGALEVNGQTLKAGDALKLVDEPQVQVSSGQGAEVLVFDLAA
jgi:redox-sensitive bicupin YhaK (pirin superfamily)